MLQFFSTHVCLHMFRVLLPLIETGYMISNTCFFSFRKNLVMVLLDKEKIIIT
jgi:hypothetical protein